MSLISGQTSGFPLGVSVLEAPDLEAPLTQNGNCLEREHAVRAPAVGDDLAVLRYLPQASREFAQRNIDGLRHVTGGVFILRPDVQHRDEAVPEALTELLARHWLEGIALVEVTSNDLAHVRDIALGHAVQRSEEHTSELQSQSNLVCRLLLQTK